MGVSKLKYQIKKSWGITNSVCLFPLIFKVLLIGTEGYEKNFPYARTENPGICSSSAKLVYLEL
jgi:hypothetical protein